MTKDRERFRIQAEFCKAMAHPLRLELIDLLKHRDATVTEMAEAVAASQANVSQHLAVLRARGVVRADRRGNEVVYSLANRKIVDACVLIRQILTEQADFQQAAITA